MTPTPRHAKERAAVQTPAGAGALFYWPVPADKRRPMGPGKGSRSKCKADVVILGRHFRFNPDEVTLL